MKWRCPRVLNYFQRVSHKLSIFHLLWKHWAFRIRLKIILCLYTRGSLWYDLFLVGFWKAIHPSLLQLTLVKKISVQYLLKLLMSWKKRTWIVYIIVVPLQPCRRGEFRLFRSFHSLLNSLSSSRIWLKLLQLLFNLT